MSEVKALHVLLSKSALFQKHVEIVIFCQQDESQWSMTEQKKKKLSKIPLH